MDLSSLACKELATPIQTTDAKKLLRHMDHLGAPCPKFKMDLLNGQTIQIFGHKVARLSRGHKILVKQPKNLTALKFRFTQM